MKIIEGNPYRQLGVYANSSTKERVANHNRLNAFLKVGKKVDFPLDLTHYLPPINRTSETVTQAESELALPNDQLKYAQFWFVKTTPLDEIAFNHLFAGNMANAMEIWSKRDNVSSLQNRFVISAINQDWKSAIRYAEVLYTNFTEEFITKIVGDVVSVSTPLWQMLIDAFAEAGINIQQFADVVTNVAWKDYIAEKTINPLIDTIGKAIDLAKSSKGEGPNARLKAGQRLMESTTSTLFQLNKLLPASDIRYQTIADKLGLEILQCAIDYFNGSDEPDAAHKAMTLQSYAMRVVVGKVAKDRCKENVDILQKIIDHLPPAEVFAEDKAIKEALREYHRMPDKICHAVTLLNNAKPHLQSIKSKLGINNSFYLKLSTQVVSSALHNVIEEVNALQNDPVFKLNMLTSKEQALNNLKNVLQAAWNAIKIMDGFDMEADFKNNRYLENKRILENICGQVGVFTCVLPQPFERRPTATWRTSNTPSTNSSSSTDFDLGCIIYIIITVIVTVICLIIGDF